MKRTKRWLALLLAGLLAVPNAAVLRAEELTDGAVVEEIASEELPVVGEEPTIINQAAITDIIVTPTDGTFMHSGDPFTIQFSTTGTTEVPEEIYYEISTNCLTDQMMQTYDYVSFDFSKVNNELIQKGSYRKEWVDWDSTSLYLDKQNMTYTLTTKFKKSNHYRINHVFINLTFTDNPSLSKSKTCVVYLDDDCANGKHTVYSNTDYTIEKEATCTEQGSKSKHCIKCDSIIEETVEEIPALGHDWGEWRTDNYHKYRQCNRCYERQYEGEGEIPVLNVYNSNWWFNHNTIVTCPYVTEAYDDKEYKLYYDWITDDQVIPEDLTYSEKTRGIWGMGEDITFSVDLETDKDFHLVMQVEDDYGNLSNIVDVVFKISERPRYSKTYEDFNYVVRGLEEPLEFKPNTYYPFTVETDGSVDPDFEKPVDGDVYWKPIGWSLENDETTHMDYKIGFLSGINADITFPMYITFNKLKYDGWNGWYEVDATTVTFNVRTKAYSEYSVTPTPYEPEIIYIPVTPTPSPVDHEAYIPPIEECSVTGIEERYYAPDKYYSFKGVGASAETKYSVRTIGDGKWIPAYWSFDEAGEDNDTRFKLGHDDGIAAGTHDLYVWFRLFKWDGEDWVATATVKSIKTQFVAEEAPTPTPTPEPEPSVTAPKTVITKLEDIGSGNLRIYWRSKGDQVDGYQIRWATNKDMTGVKTATYTGINNTTRPNLSVGKVYYVGVRTFVMNDGKKVYSEWSGTKALKLTRTLATPSVSGANQKGNGIQTKWFTVADAEGYQLRFCQDPSFKGTRTAFVNGQNKTSFTKYGLGSGTWYVAVRAYKTAEDGTRYYSAWGGAQTVTL